MPLGRKLVLILSFCIVMQGTPRRAQALPAFLQPALNALNALSSAAGLSPLSSESFDYLVASGGYLLALNLGWKTIAKAHEALKGHPDYHEKRLLLDLAISKLEEAQKKYKSIEAKRDKALSDLEQEQSRVYRDYNYPNRDKVLREFDQRREDEKRKFFGALHDQEKEIKRFQDHRNQQTACLRGMSRLGLLWYGAGTAGVALGAFTYHRANLGDIDLEKVKENIKDNEKRVAEDKRKEDSDKKLEAFTRGAVKTAFESFSDPKVRGLFKLVRSDEALLRRFSSNDHEARKLLAEQYARLEDPEKFEGAFRDAFKRELLVESMMVNQLPYDAWERLQKAKTEEDRRRYEKFRNGVTRRLFVNLLPDVVGEEGEFYQKTFSSHLMQELKNTTDEVLLGSSERK